MDDELPVLPSSSQASGPVIRAVGSSVITQSHQSSSGNGSSAGATPSPTVSKATPSRSGHTTSVATTRTPHQSAPTSGVLSSSTAARGHHQQQQHGTGTGTVVTPHSQSTIVLDGAGTGDGRTDYVSSVPPVAGMQRKRARRASIENRYILHVFRIFYIYINCLYDEVSFFDTSLSSSFNLIKSMCVK